MNKNYSTTAMPNRGFGAQRRKEINPEALTKGLREIGVMDNAAVFREAMKRSEEISQTDWAIIGRIENDQTRADILRKKLRLNSISPIPDESICCELKSGFRAIPETYWDHLPRGGMKLAITELTAIHNTVGKGEVWIGVADSSDHHPTGLESQISCMYPGMSLDRFQSTVLFNLARNWTNSLSFLSSIGFEWFLLNGHLVLKMTVDRKNNDDVALCNPHDWILPYRVGTSLRLARGYDLLKIFNMLNQNK